MRFLVALPPASRYVTLRDRKITHCRKDLPTGSKGSYSLRHPPPGEQSPDNRQHNPNATARGAVPRRPGPIGPCTGTWGHAQAPSQGGNNDRHPAYEGRSSFPSFRRASRRSPGQAGPAKAPPLAGCAHHARVGSVPGDRDHGQRLRVCQPRDEHRPAPPRHRSCRASYSRHAGRSDVPDHRRCPLDRRDRLPRRPTNRATATSSCCFTPTPTGMAAEP